MEQAGEGLLTSGSEGEQLLGAPEGNGDNRSTGAGSEGTPEVTKRSEIYGYEKMFSDKIKGHPAFEGLETPDKLGQSYIDLKSKIGKSLVPPDENATDEERYEFLRKAGVPTRPETQDDYVFENPAGVPEADLSWFKQVAFDLGLPQDAANTLQSEFRLAQAKRLREQGENAASELSKEERRLFREWGNEKDERVELANRALSQFIAGDEEIVDFIKELTWHGVPARQHPHMRRLFARIGEATSEGEGPRTDAQGPRPEGRNGGRQRFPGLDKL